MKLSGSGRIIFWRGGSLWIGLSGEPTKFHSHHAIQFSFSLTGEALHFRTPNTDWSPYTAAIIPAHQSHALEARNIYVAMIFVEPESSEGLALKKLYTGQVIAEIDTHVAENELTILHSRFTTGATDAQIAEVARTLVSRYSDTMSPGTYSLDGRIRHAIALIHERIGETISLADIAAEVHLSPDRFRHLFIDETGIRFRPYVLWLRIETALAVYAAKKNLTEASHAGGFADSAHFSRTFARMFGIAPSSIKIE